MFAGCDQPYTSANQHRKVKAGTHIRCLLHRNQHEPTGNVSFYLLLTLFNYKIRSDCSHKLLEPLTDYMYVFFLYLGNTINQERCTLFYEFYGHRFDTVNLYIEKECRKLLLFIFFINTLKLSSFRYFHRKTQLFKPNRNTWERETHCCGIGNFHRIFV